MEINIERTDYYQDIASWHCLLLPSLGVGYCRGLLSISLYLFVWEFSINFEWADKL